MDDEDALYSNHAYRWYDKAAKAGDPIGTARVNRQQDQAVTLSAGRAKFDQEQRAEQAAFQAKMTRLSSSDTSRPGSTLEDAAKAITDYANRKETASARDTREHKQRQDKADSEWEKRQSLNTR